MEGKAYCHGAATIINGIALGLGAAFGIGLTTKARVELTSEPEIFAVNIQGDEDENPQLAEYCVLKVLSMFGLEKEYGAKISTSSDIPISRGLKSSSAASNAIVLAALSALNKEASDMDIINIGINASLRAKVTLTGAFDDACATYFGGVVVTDNITREILTQYPIEKDYEVIIHVPHEKIRKSEVNIQKLKGIRGALKEAHDLALKRDFLDAIKKNGLAYGTAMGLDCGVTERALDAGALTAGITGTGPATVILAEADRKDEIISAIGSEGEIVCTKLNREKAGSI